MIPGISEPGSSGFFQDTAQRVAYQKFCPLKAHSDDSACCRRLARCKTPIVAYLGREEKRIQTSPRGESGIRSQLCYSKLALRHLL